MKNTVTLQAQKIQAVWEKSLGLLRGKPRIIFFETRWGIHTFGMKYAIIILILNEKNEVILQKKIRPNTIFLWNPLYKKVLEIPEALHIKGIDKGTKIIILHV